MFLCLSTPGPWGWVPAVIFSCAGTWLGKTLSFTLAFFASYRKGIPVGMKHVLYPSSKAVRLSGFVLQLLKTNLLVADPLEWHPFPPLLLQNPQSILFGFLTVISFIRILNSILFFSSDFSKQHLWQSEVQLLPSFYWIVIFNIGCLSAHNSAHNKYSNFEINRLLTSSWCFD